MTYHIEYRTSDSAVRIKTGDDLELMLKVISRAGCRFRSPNAINQALSWSEVAYIGERLFVPCVGGCSCTIRFGEEQMTEYTSY